MGLDVAHEHEAVLLEHADRRRVLRVGAGGHRRVRAETEHHVGDERADRRGADAAPDEPGVAEQVVHPRGAGIDADRRARLAVLGVVAHVVHLEVADVVPVEDEQPGLDRFVAVHRARDVADLRRLPPRSDVGLVQPRRDERQVVGGHAPERRAGCSVIGSPVATEQHRAGGVGDRAGDERDLRAVDL